MIRVIIPTDFSENATNAINYAMELFKYELAEITVIHCYADEVYEHDIKLDVEDFEFYKEKVKEASDRQLQETVKEMLFNSPNPKHTYKYQSAFKNLVDALNDLSIEHEIDMIVMGTRGQSDLSYTIGSNTLQTIKYVRIPVFIVPHKYHDIQPQHILFPTNLNLPYKKWELKLLATIARRFSCDVTFLYVTKQKQLSRRQQHNKGLIEDYFENIKHEHIIEDGQSIIDVIHEIEEKKKIDLLVMVNYRHSFLEEMLHIGIVSELSLTTSIPFLTLQNLDKVSPN